MYNSPNREHVLVCAEWPYARRSIHVGQIAATILPGDIFARFHRMAGHAVLMVSGSDPYGSALALEADRLGITPQEVDMRNHRQIRPTWERLGLEFDIYVNTTTDSHRRTTQEVFLKLLDLGYVFKDSMDAPYCSNDKRFLPDRQVEGNCPYCSSPAARGDRCENCGRMLDPAQLLDPRCRLCGKPSVEMLETEHFFLDLPQFAVKLRQWLKSEKEHWRSSTLNFALNWLQEGLAPRAITRDQDFGIPVPLAGYEGKRFFIWFDAVIGYFSATVEWAEREGNPGAWKKWWEPHLPGDSSPTHAYYFVETDSVAFHTIFWPAVLMGLGGMTLPYDVPASELVTMSSVETTAGHAATNGTQALQDLLDKYGSDSLRFYLASVLPEQRDTYFSYQDLVRHNNDELVATYGNAVHRVLTFLHRNFNGIVPQPGQFSPRDQVMLQQIPHSFTAAGEAITKVHLRDGLNTAMSLARNSNRYLDEQAPWKRMITDPTGAATTVYVMLQVLNGLKVLFAPYLPFSSQKLHQLLGYPGSVSECRWEVSVLPQGWKLPAPTPLFMKFDMPPANILG